MPRAAGLYHVRSGPQQKNARSQASKAARPQRAKMVHIDHMARPLSLPDRRDMLAGLSAMVLGTLAFRPVAAQAPQALALRAKVGEIAPGPGPVHRSRVPVWVLE